MRKNTIKRMTWINFSYTRKSTDEEDRQILSLDSQGQTIETLATLQSENIPHQNQYSDSRSARSANKRPNFNIMIERVKEEISKGNFVRFFVWKANRLARNFEEGGIISDMVKDGRATVISQTKTYGEFDSEQLNDEFTKATGFSKDLSCDVKRGLNDKVLMGWRPGKAPIGYINDIFGVKGAKKIFPDPERTELMKGYLNLVANGENVVNALRIVTGKGLTVRTKNGNKPLSRKQAYDVLRNPFYYGYFMWNGELIEGKHEPLITKELWDKIQRQLSGRHYDKPKQNNYFFMRLLKCINCDHFVTCDSQKGHVYTKCKCSGVKHLKAEDVNNQVIEFIGKLRTTPGFVKWYTDTLKEVNEEEFEKIRSTKIQQTKRQDAILGELKQLTSLQADLPHELYLKDKNRLLGELETIKSQIVDSTDLDSWIGDLERLFNFSESCKELFNGGDEDTRRLVTSILSRSNLVLDDGIVRIQAKKAFVFLKDKENTSYAKSALVEPQIMPNISPEGVIASPKVTLGAGRGNRTPAERLEIFRSTIKLYLHLFDFRLILSNLIFF